MRSSACCRSPSSSRRSDVQGPRVVALADAVRRFDQRRNRPRQLPRDEPRADQAERQQRQRDAGEHAAHALDLTALAGSPAGRGCPPASPASARGSPQICSVRRRAARRRAAGSRVTISGSRARAPAPASARPARSRPANTHVAARIRDLARSRRPAPRAAARRSRRSRPHCPRRTPARAARRSSCPTSSARASQIGFQPLLDCRIGEPIDVGRRRCDARSRQIPPSSSDSPAPTPRASNKYLVLRLFAIVRMILVHTNGL